LKCPRRFKDYPMLPETMNNLSPLKEKAKGSTIFLFVLAGIAIFLFVFVGGSAAWFLEQNAIASESLAVLGKAGIVWFLAQAFILALACGIAVAVSKSIFRSVYRTWMIASLITLPALGLRFLGPNNDQVGAFIQILIGLVGGVAVLLYRRLVFRFDRRSLFALAIVPLGIWPFLLWGAFGSGTDIILNLLAGLAFGLLVASLVVTTESNTFLNGLGLGVLIAILGSAYGYDGGQLLLIVVLPMFGFALVEFASSVSALAVGIGLLAAAPLIFIDPTELTIVLGDLLPWAMRASFSMLGLGILVSLAVWIGRKWVQSVTFNPLIASILTWGLAVVVYGFFGLHGFYGDRLFVIFKDQADLSQAAQIKDLASRRTFVYKTLTDEATSTQAGLRQTLDRFGIHYTPYYLVNAMEVDGSALVRLYLLRRPEVDRIIPSPRLRAIPQLTPPMSGALSSVQEDPGWNITMIGADRVWKDFGVTGEGIVVGQSDTGVDGEHPALKDSYRGLTQGDDYNWYDPWTNSKSPNDQEGHGTHTLGIVVGKGGIGIAPDAQWIGCVNLERNLGDPALYLNCMQFMLAPFPYGGDPFKDGDPARAADVLNNSWGCPTLEGCDAGSFRPAVEALRAAGIFMVVSAGNDGPVCSTLDNPPAIYASVLSVGAVDQGGNVAPFSSRGPVTIDGSDRIKPDISAPGVDVVSSLPNGTYGSESGTSMAGPHLVGVVALMWSANPGLIGDIDRTDQILIQTATPYAGAEPPGECFTGGKPNNAYGYGIVDAYNAVKMALGK
jgi:subtilisin family serine protease